MAEDSKNRDGERQEKPYDEQDASDRERKLNPEQGDSVWRGSPVGGFRVFSESAMRRLNEAFAPMYQRMAEQILAATKPQMDAIAAKVAETMRPQLAALTDEWATAFTERFARITVPALVTPQLQETLERLRDRVREATPPNWPERIDFGLVTMIMADEGLPLVHVPRAEIVSEMLAAPDRAARIEVLLGRVDDLVEDCRVVLGEVTSPDLTERTALTGRVIDALADGHFEAAQALAVNIAESLIYEEFGSYARAVDVTRFAPESVALWELRLRAAIAPIGAFYVPYHRADAVPVPVAVSRHATVHRPGKQTLSKAHAVVVTLFLTSLLRAVDEERQAGSDGGGSPV
jgi:hypothetical protein